MKCLVIKIYRPDDITRFGYWSLFKIIRRAVNNTMLHRFRREHQMEFENYCKVTIQLIDEKT